MNKAKNFLVGKIRQKVSDTLETYEEELRQKIDLPDALESALGLSDDQDGETPKASTKLIPLQEDEFLSELKRADVVPVPIKGAGVKEEEGENDRKESKMNKANNFPVGKIRQKVTDPLETYQGELRQKIDLPDTLESVLGLSDDQDDQARKASMKGKHKMNKAKNFLVGKIRQKVSDTLETYQEELRQKIDLPDALESALGLSDDGNDATRKASTKPIPLQEDEFLSEGKRVDFVLVAIKGAGDKEEENERKRRVFEKNLHDNGLLLQHVKPTMPDEQEWAGYAEVLGGSIYKAVKERNIKAVGSGLLGVLRTAAKPFAKMCIKKVEEETGFDNQFSMDDDEEEKADEGPQLIFTLIHAPFETLAKCAETMMLRVPIREPDEQTKTSPSPSPFCKACNVFRIANPSVKEEKRYINAFFKREKLDIYLCKDKENIFNGIDRSRMVFRLLKSAYFSTEPEDFGIKRLLHDNIYDDAYSLHDGDVDILSFSDDSPKNDRQRLVRDWASFGRWYKYQPLNAIKSYFGTRVAMYFAWLGTYTTMLVSASIVGVICFLGGFFTINDFIPAQDVCNKNNSKLFYMCPLCDKNCSFWSLTTSCQYARYSHAFDYQGTVLFAVFMSFWSVVFLEVWKRKQISLAYEWDMMHFDEDFEPPRPAFIATVKERRPNPVTGIMEPYIPRVVRTGRYMVATVAITMMILLVLASVFGVVVYRAIVIAVMSASPNKNLQGSGRIYTSLTSAVLNLLSIVVLSKLYIKLAFALTDWENPRTMTEYNDILTIKMFLFQAVNMYSSFFYIAFFKTSFVTGIPGHYHRIAGVRMEGCDPSGCLMALCIQLLIILGGNQFKSQVQEILIPTVKRLWKRKSRVKMTDVISTDKQGLPYPQWERDYLLSEEPEFRMFEEYLEMVLQFGFVTMFVAAFPLAPLLALLNNILEIRADAINFVVNHRRPTAQRAQDIGAWFDVLSSIATAAVVLNSFVIAFTSEFIPREVYKYAFSPDGSLRGYMNNSLSYFNVKDLEQQPSDPFKNLPYNETHCRFKDYFSPRPPYNFTLQYYYVLAARLAFIVVFNGFVFFVVKILAWLIPDVPYSLDIKIKREEYLARESLVKSEIKNSVDQQNNEILN